MKGIHVQMRIAAISDIHGNLAALEAVLADIDRRGADLIVNLGDILSGPLQPRETADRLMALGFPTIRGNHERQLLTGNIEDLGGSDRYARTQLSREHLDWLRELPAQLHTDPDVLLVHGTPGSDVEYFLETVETHGARPATTDEIQVRAGSVDAKLILCGHTHVPRVAWTDHGRMIVNPGSVGIQAYTDDRPFPHKMETGTPAARYAIIEKAGGAWSAQLLSVEYNWQVAAQLAADRGRPDWAVALATGTVG